MTQYAVGDIVTLTSPIEAPRIGGDNWGGAPTVRARTGTSGIITRLGRHRHLVRFELDTPQSCWVSELDFMLADPNAPRPRKLGEKPEGDEYIDPKDPGLAWLWDDISRYAAKSNYCETFDHILRELSLPPRKRSFTAVGALGDLTISASFLAGSQAEANQMLADQLAFQVQRAAAEQ